MNITLNASDYFTSPTGQALPDITATVRDLGIGEALYFSFLIWVACVILHEFAHWLVMLRYNPNAEIIIKRAGIGLQLQTGREEDYVNLTSDQRIMVYMAGICAGLLPIIIAGAIHPLYYLVLPAYVVGTYRDVQLIIRSLQNSNNVKQKV